MVLSVLYEGVFAALHALAKEHLSAERFRPMDESSAASPSETCSEMPTCEKPELAGAIVTGISEAERGETENLGDFTRYLSDEDQE